MKKFLSIMLSVITTACLVSGLTACGTSNTATTSNTTAPVTTTASNSSEATSGETSTTAPVETTGKVLIPSDLPSKTIAVVYSSFADKNGSLFKTALESLAEPFNVDFKFIETAGMTTEQGLAAVETALQSGIDGLISAAASPAILEAAKAAGNVPVVLFGVQPSTDLSGYDNYLGVIANDDYDLGYKEAQFLYDAGCRKIGVCGITAGLAKNHDDRLRGFKEHMAELDGMEIVAEDLSRGQFANAISAFAAAYPEMDGLFTTLSNESIYQTLLTEGLVGKIKFATADISESVPDYFENGTLVYIAGGQYNIIMSAFAVMYNEIYDGTRLIPAAKVSEIVYTPFVGIGSLDDYNNYLTYVEGDQKVYSPDEIAEMIVAFNPDMTSEKFVQINLDYSLQDIMDRHEVA